MILWEYQARKGWAHDPVLHLEGKRFERWVEPELLKEISDCFSTYSIEKTWKSLLNMIELFNRTAKSMAKELGLEYPEKASQDIGEFIKKLKSNMAPKGGRPPLN
jgi:hypothetical protein